VAVISTDWDKADQLLSSFSKKKGYVIHTRGKGEQWSGYGFKLRHTLNIAKKLRQNEVLMHLDAFDTFVLTDASEVLEKFRKTGANIVVSTETVLAPTWEFNNQDIQKEMDRIYPKGPNRFRWINSGTYIGYAGAIVNLLTAMGSDFHCDLPTGQKMSSCDDQRCFHTFFLKENNPHKIMLDYNQDIFHCMQGVDKYSLSPKRLYSETGSMPCVLHGNGQAASFNEVVKELKS
jgi:hypothetical protein